MSAAELEHLQQDNARIKRFILKRDAQTINLACEGMGTDDELLIDVVCARNKAQLQQIKQFYFDKYKKSMADELRSECGGCYGRFLQYVLMERAEFDAYTLNDAMEGIGCNEEIVAELYLTRSAAELNAMRAAWEGTHDAQLLDRLKSELGGDMENFIMKLFKCKNDGHDTDPEEATQQANALYEAGPGRRFGTDEEPFIRILATSTREQIELIKKAYAHHRNQSLEQCIQKEFGGKVRDALLGALEDPIDLLCVKLRAAFKGLGTDEATVIRILGGYDHDVVERISQRYQQKYDRSLIEDLRSELSGNVRQAVVKWVKAKDITDGLCKFTEAPAPSDDAGIAERIQHLQDEQEALRRCLASWDANLIRRACKGMGTDEQSLIRVLCKRTKEQMDRIDAKFRERFNQTLRAQLEVDLSGDFKRFMVYTQMEEDEFDASIIREAMQGLGTNEDLLLEVLTTRSHARIERAREYYEKHYDENLLDRINSELSGDLKKLADRILTRDRDSAPDDFDPEDKATQLYDASVGRTFGTDEDKFIQIFTVHSVAQLQRIGEAFETKYNRSLIGVVEKEFGGDLRDALLALCQDPIDYFAYRLKRAFSGLGTDDAAVCRVLGGNNKATAMRIAERYFQKYNVRLEQSLKSELSGTFRRAAVAWVSSQDPTRGEDEAEAEHVEEKIEETPAPRDPPAAAVEEKQPDEKTAAREAQRQALLEQKRRERQEEEARRQLQLAALQQVQSRLERAKARLATVQGARLPTSGAIVGRFDPEEYNRINGVGGEAWAHFLQAGFNEGCLLTVRTPVGVFAGIFDHDSYLQRNGIEPTPQDQPPYHPQEQAWSDLQTKQADVLLPIKPAVALAVFGRFVTGLYYQANPDVAAFAHKPRPGAFDGAMYLKIHREIGRTDPFEHYIDHGFGQNRDIVVNGRRGKLNKHWYRRQHDANRVKHHLEHHPHARLKVKGRRMDGWQHYATYGHAEGRRIVVANGLGVFEGVFDKHGYQALHGDTGRDALEHYLHHGHGEGLLIAITNLELKSLFSANFEDASTDPQVDIGSLVAERVDSSDEEDDDPDDDDDDD